MKIPNFDEIKSRIPKEVKDICMNYEGWIVGGSARTVLGLEGKAKDWDVLIPFYRWGDTCLIIPKGTPANSFGGFKLDKNDFQIDIWAGDIGYFLGNYFKKDKENYAINLVYQTVLYKI